MPANTTPTPTRKTINGREIDALIARAADLEPRAKFELYEALRAQVAATVSDESDAAKRTRERVEALEAIDQVVDHLGLGPQVAPTVKEFDRVAGSLGLEWNSARVIRAWERWRLARDAYVGKRAPEVPEQRRARRNRGGGRPRSRADYLIGVREWLATNPAVETRIAYDAYVEKRIGEGASPAPVRVETLRRALSLPWEQIIAAARGEVTLEEAVEVATAAQMPAKRRGALVGIAAIARLLGEANEVTRQLIEGEDFPAAVATIAGHRAWLALDVRTHHAGHSVPDRSEGGLQQNYIDRPELEERLQMKPRTLWRMIREKRWDRVPPPEGAVVAGAYYWKREMVETWEAAREAQRRKTTEKKKPAKKIEPRARKHGFRTRTNEHYLAGVRRWLETDPQPESQAAYEAFVAAHRGEVEGVALAALGTIRHALPVGWSEVLAMAKGEKSPARAVADIVAAESPPLLPGALVGLSGMARVLGVSAPTASTWSRREDFPRRAATISGHAAWLLSEIRTYAGREGFPARAHLDLQDDYLDAQQVIELLGLEGMEPLRKLRLKVRAGRWDKAPQPEGQVAQGAYYWRREKVEAWLEVREGLARTGSKA